MTDEIFVHGSVPLQICSNRVKYWLNFDIQLGKYMGNVFCLLEFHLNAILWLSLQN